jgi:ATP-binding cassette subfamily B protein
MRNPYFSLLGTAWRYARQERKQFILVYALFITANLIVASHPILYGWFVNALQREGSNILPSVWMYAGGFIALKLLEWSCHGPSRVMERRLGFHLSSNYLNELYHQLVHLPVGWHKDHHSGATISRIRKAYESLKEFFQNGFIYIHTLGKFIISVGAMLFFSPVFGAIGVVIGIFTIWVIMQFDKPFIKAIKETNEREHEVSSTLFDSLSNIISVITLRLESRMEEGLKDKIKKVFPAFNRQVTINEWKWFTATMLVSLIYLVEVVGYVYTNWNEGSVFMIGGLVTLMAYVNQFTSVFNDVAFQYTRIVYFNTDVQAAKSISDAFEQHRRPESSGNMPADWKTLDIKYLNFSHGVSPLTGKKAPGLNNLQIRIRQGQKIALIGESGCGKSTLLTLLRGLYQPEPGTLTKVDGKKVINFESIADTVSLFPQEPEIFENTIRYNITLGLPFSDEEIMEACEITNFADVLRQMPDGLETCIQEKGVNLSGGQKQRLALARGVLAARSSSILLMDEPTSSLDPRSEVKIYDKFFEACAGKAVISSLHRLHLLSKFDYVYILDKGKVVDEGTFEQLKNNSAKFQELWQHQSQSVEISGAGNKLPDALLPIAS